ncbi:MATE family efflux transporter [Corallococcus sicarius]|uniref:MATE family efflux transporter n=1 Tax=Corallococcus sicarius TaxID=2316726 RepID=A0A3A8N4I0_9BACT|nr:MATE family efflux transporter [Corallococcus sicarius]RKH39307.1 hypothetical protein D7X12_23915 [Corallococcus sicarius]
MVMESIFALVDVLFVSHLGAGDTDRAERTAWRASFYTLAFLGTVAVGFLLFAEPLIHHFTTDPDVGLHTTRGLRIVSCSLALYAFVTVLPHAFNGAGDTTTPTVVNLVFSWGLQLPRLAPRPSAGVGTHGSVRHHRCHVRRAGAGERGPLPSRTVEAAARLMPHAANGQSSLSRG